MNIKFTSSITSIGVGLLMASMLGTAAYAAEAESNVPSYAEGVKELDAKMHSGKNAIKIDEKDLAVMTKAGADLAAQMPNPGLKVGEKAPEFTLKDPQGKKVRLKKLLKNGPVVLTFYRGAWCPYCNLQIHQLKASLPEIKKYGGTIVAITPQQPDKSLEQFKKDGFPFPVLSDLDYKVIKSYNLYWEVPEELHETYKHAFGLDVTAFNGKGRRGLPIPGTYVIDKSGIIRAAFAETDYKQRMEPAAIVAALKSIAK